MEILTQPEVQMLSEAYRIGPIDDWQTNSRGTTNATFELGSEFFVTVFSRRSADELELLAETANELPETVPIARPLYGDHGYSVSLEAGPVLLTPRLHGEHYVGASQIEKRIIPVELHRPLARFFWDLQRGLSAAPDARKQALQNPHAVHKIEIPEVLPESLKPLTNHAPAGYEPTTIPAYPDLVHDDLERQNILLLGSRVTGLVDLDSLMSGDILYEFGHFLFNSVFCDPAATLDTPIIYLEELEKAGMIASADISALHSSIYRFVLYDMFETQEIAQRYQRSNESSAALVQWVAHYEKGLLLAKRFFECHFPSS